MSARTKEERAGEGEVRKAQRGDAEAFGLLVSRYLPLVGSVAYSIVGDSHVAEDVAQETFQKAFLRLRSLRDPKRFGSWLYGIAKSTSIDWLRKNRGRRLGTAELDRLPAAADNEETGPERNAVREEERGIVTRALFDLPDRYREVLVLKHMKDLSYSEVARFMGTSIPAVESLLFRARTAFREKLRRHGIGPAPHTG